MPTETHSAATFQLHAAHMPLNSYPLLKDGWSTLDDESLELLRPRVEQALQHQGLPEWLPEFELGAARAALLPFYPGFMLVEWHAARGDGTQGLLDVLLGPGFIACVTGKSDVLHGLNSGALREMADGEPRCGALADLSDHKQALAYLRFFCGAVRGEAGAFHLVESEADLVALGVTPVPQQLKALAIPAIVLEPEDPPDVKALQPKSLKAQATVLYSGCLFRAKFDVDFGGQVEMEDDVTLATDVAPRPVILGPLRHVEYAEVACELGEVSA